MNVNQIIAPIGDFLEWTFGVFEIIGNSFNNLVIIFGFVALIFWLIKQKKYNAQAEENATQIK